MWATKKKFGKIGKIVDVFGGVSVLSAIPRFPDLSAEVLMSVVWAFGFDLIPSRYKKSSRLLRQLDNTPTPSPERKRGRGRSRGRGGGRGGGRGRGRGRGKEQSASASTSARGRGGRRSSLRRSKGSEEKEKEQEEGGQTSSTEDEQEGGSRVLETNTHRFDVSWVPGTLSATARHLVSNGLREETTFGESAINGITKTGNATVALNKILWQHHLTDACLVRIFRMFALFSPLLSNLFSCTPCVCRVFAIFSPEVVSCFTGSWGQAIKDAVCLLAQPQTY